MYQALYRKWRPLTFDDVVSQPHITSTLQNQIQSGKTAHAYLFTGSRGTGKTTCSRIFAKAINCENPVGGNPCLECSVCRDADASALSDLIEIDAASNNGVDDIRDLREGAVFTPERCRYKVYIIDEVHMLSINAFNALLKIMEEPPAYVKFILATTEVHKVPATILSRCQRFDFRRILPDDIAARLLYVAGQENVSLDENAAGLIARIADGGMRDALSLLDQCIAYSEHITLDTVSTAAGIAGRDYLFELLDAVVREDAGAALTVIDRLYGMSKDMQRLCEELISQFRNLMLVKTVPAKTDLLACMPEECEKLQSLAKKLELSAILSKLTLLQECNERLSRSLTKRIELEMCMISLCTKNLAANSAGSVDNSGIYAKIEQLEEQLKAVPKTASQPAPASQTKPSSAKLSSEPKPPASSPEPPDLSKLRSEDFKPCALWAEILEEFDKVLPAVSGTLRGSHAFVNGNLMLINAENAFFLKLFRIPENATVLGDTVKKITGQAYTIRARCTAAAKEEEQRAVNLVEKAKENNIPVEMQ